jgi:hypothetical protein
LIHSSEALAGAVPRRMSIYYLKPQSHPGLNYSRRPTWLYVSSVLYASQIDVETDGMEYFIGETERIQPDASFYLSRRNVYFAGMLNVAVCPRCFASFNLLSFFE